MLKYLYGKTNCSAHTNTNCYYVTSRTPLKLNCIEPERAVAKIILPAERTPHSQMQLCDSFMRH